MVDVVNVDSPIQFKSIDEAIGAFVKSRDELTVLRRAFEAQELDMKNFQEQIQMWLRDKADELGVDSFTSREYGTAFRSIKTSYRVEDFDAFIAWIKETDNFQCLEKRCAKNAVKEVHDDLGNLPPGLYYNVEVTMDIRKPTKATKVV